MIDPKEQAGLDQSTAFMIEFLPPLWRGLYEQNLERGFTEQQAFDLVKAYIIAQGSGDKKP